MSGDILRELETELNGLDIDGDFKDKLMTCAKVMFALETERDAALARIAVLEREAKEREIIEVIFDGPPGHESGRFVEVEDGHGESINAGEWIKRRDGLWALRIQIKKREGVVV